MPTIDLIRADITKVKVDAIVNAANSSLLGGGGVDGAIHRAAGPELLAKCKTLSGCTPGEAKVTPGYKLPAKYVIHTVGPVWLGGSSGEAEILAKCYRSCLGLAVDIGIANFAFPSISTGAFGYPVYEAAVVAMSTLAAFQSGNRAMQALDVTFVLFSDTDLGAYELALQHQNQRSS